jgi:hypothetical protein
MPPTRRAPDDAVVPTRRHAHPHPGAGHPHSEPAPRAERAARRASLQPCRIAAVPQIELDHSQRSGWLGATMRWVVEQLMLGFAGYAVAMYPELMSHPQDRYDGDETEQARWSPSVIPPF